MAGGPWRQGAPSRHFSGRRTERRLNDAPKKGVQAHPGTSILLSRCLALRNCRRPSAKFRKAPHARSRWPTPNPMISFDRPLLVLAQLLPLSVASTHVFRAAVVSIVLTLAVGQNAALLCSVWCHPPEAATGVCEHPPVTSPSVTGNDSCTVRAAEATALVREDVRRGATPDAQHGVVVAWFQFGPPPAHSTSGRQLRQTPLRASPLILALRI